MSALHLELSGRTVDHMPTVNVFVDTCTVNRLLDIDNPRTHDATYESDRSCLYRIAEEYADHDIVRLFVNPTVKWEIEKTANLTRRKQLVQEFDRLHFMPFSTSVFPLLFPVTFVSTEVKQALDDIFACVPQEYKKDMKILADVMSSEEIEILLTTDREHLANDRFRSLVKQKSPDKKIAILTPRELLRRLAKPDVLAGRGD